MLAVESLGLSALLGCALYAPLDAFGFLARDEVVEAGFFFECRGFASFGGLVGGVSLGLPRRRYRLGWLRAQLLRHRCQAHRAPSMRELQPDPGLHDSVVSSRRLKRLRIRDEGVVRGDAPNSRSTLLPSQDYSNVFSVKTCEDAGVLVNVQSALEEHLNKKVALGSDIRLIMVRVDAGIECTVSMITSGTKETISYFVAFDEAESGTPIYRLEVMSDKIIDKIVRVVVNP